MKNNLFKLFILIVNIMILLILGLFFFSNKDFSYNHVETSRKIGVCYMTLGSDYYYALNTQIESIVEKKGDYFIKRDSFMNQTIQNQQIIELVDEGVEGLFIVPVDWKKVKSALTYAKEAGVKVVIVDTKVFDESLVDVTVTSDNYDIGVQLANYLMIQKDAANVLMISCHNIKSSMDRVQGFKDTLSQNEQYIIVDELISDGRADTTYQLIAKQYQLMSNFDTIFAINDSMALGALSAWDQNQDRTINILSVNGSPAVKKMILNHKMMVTAAQFPSQMGLQASNAMYYLLNGVDVQKNIKIPIKLVTKYTINRYDVEKWQ